MNLLIQKFKKFFTFSTDHKDSGAIYFLVLAVFAGLSIIVYGLGGFASLYQNPLIYVFGKLPKPGLIMIAFTSLTLLGIQSKSPKILNFVDRFIAFTQQNQINLSIVLIIWFSLNAFYLSQDFQLIFGYPYVVAPHGTFLELFAVCELITVVLSMVVTLLYITVFNNSFKDFVLSFAIFILSWVLIKVIGCNEIVPPGTVYINESISKTNIVDFYLYFLGGFLPAWFLGYRLVFLPETFLQRKNSMLQQKGVLLGLFLKKRDLLLQNNQNVMNISARLIDRSSIAIKETVDYVSTNSLLKGILLILFGAAVDQLVQTNSNNVFLMDNIKLTVQNELLTSANKVLQSENAALKVMQAASDDPLKNLIKNNTLLGKLFFRPFPVPGHTLYDQSSIKKVVPFPELITHPFTEEKCTSEEICEEYISTNWD